MAEEGKFGEGKQEGVGETVDITIVLQPDGFRHGISVPVTYTVENVAEDVGKDLSLDPSGMRVLYEGKEVPSGTTLTALNIQPGETDAMRPMGSCAWPSCCFRGTEGGLWWHAYCIAHNGTRGGRCCL